MIEKLRDRVPDAKQVWYADDGGGASTLDGVKVWWDHLIAAGPKYGLHPKESKTVLILKNPDDIERARELFGTIIQITTEGGRHIGAALGTQGFTESYISEKVANWVNDIEQLAKIAKEDPQAALCAYNTGLCRRWSFIQRTVKGIGYLFQPIEDILRQEFIPSILGKQVSDIERSILSPPIDMVG